MQNDEPVTQPVNPPARTKKTREQDAPTSDEPLDGWARAERVLANWGAYWGRAMVAAWRTVFPKREKSQ